VDGLAGVAASGHTWRRANHHHQTAGSDL